MCISSMRRSVGAAMSQGNTKAASAAAGTPGARWWGQEPFAQNAWQQGLRQVGRAPRRPLQGTLPVALAGQSNPREGPRTPEAVPLPCLQHHQHGHPTDPLQNTNIILIRLSTKPCRSRNGTWPCQRCRHVAVFITRHGRVRNTQDMFLPCLPHLQRHQHGQAAHELWDEAVADEVGVLHVQQDVAVDARAAGPAQARGAHLGRGNEQGRGRS